MPLTRLSFGRGFGLFEKMMEYVIAAPPEKLAYVAAYYLVGRSKDAMAVLDTDLFFVDLWEGHRLVGAADRRDELHHFGWNACSSALAPLKTTSTTARRWSAAT